MTMLAHLSFPAQRRIRPLAGSLRSQRGIAAVLIVLLVGLSLTAGALGVMYQLRSFQDEQMTLHAQTEAQVKAWTGAEIVRRYLASLAATSTATQVLVQQMEANRPLTLAITGTGLSGITAQLTAADSYTAPTTVTAHISATVNSGTKAATTSTLEVVYSLTGSAATSSGGSIPAAAAVFNGDLSITGGTTSITNNLSNLSNIAVNGALTISGASAAGVSGCTTGGITLSGGGVQVGSQLYSEGDITISGMSPPTNVNVWGRNVKITQEGGSYTQILAGAFNATVKDGSGTTIGKAYVGGDRLTSGNILPPSTGYALLTLTDGTQYAVDLSKATIASDGTVTNLTAGAIQLSGTGTISATQATFQFDTANTTNGIYGGTLAFATAPSVGTVWGNAVSLTGWSGTYSAVKYYSSFNVVTGTIASLTGGGDMWATQAGYSIYSAYNFPTVTAGQIAGHLYASSAKTLVPDSATVTGVSVVRNQTGTSPGLPGLPYCNVAIDTVDAANYKSDANYVFYFDSSTGDPMLLIQNVKDSSGNTIASGPYDLKTADVRTIGGHDFMQCGWYNSYCFRDATASTGWQMTGVYKFPPGIAWFDGNLTINGVATSGSTLTNTFVTPGNITLGSSSGTIYAPNFANVSTTCGGNFYASNVCSSPTALATWTDSTGTTHTGYPLANMALLANGALSTSGWTIYGNVTLGGSLSTNGATTTITGALAVGANGTAATGVTAGGLKVITTNVTTDQIYTPGGSSSGTGTGTSTGSTSVGIKWARYL